MSKLSFEELKKKAKEVEIKELMESISGGTENACHDSFDPYRDVPGGFPGYQPIRSTETRKPSFKRPPGI